MAKHQTRRSISVSAVVYAALQQYCQQNGSTMSATVEELVCPLVGISVPAQERKARAAGKTNELAARRRIWRERPDTPRAPRTGHVRTTRACTWCGNDLPKAHVGDLHEQCAKEHSKFGTPG